MQKITGRRLSVVLLSATFLAALGTASLRADDLLKVGIVGSIHGEVTGATEGHASALQAGDPVYLNETVKTGKGGAAQLMLLDRSSLTVTPDSEVKVDTFVYDPATASGKLSLQGVRGAFRFIGGALSKKGYATIKTPVSTIGIRGGIVQASIADNGSSAEAIFVYGHDMTIWNSHGEQESSTDLFGHGYAMLGNGIQNLAPEQVIQHIQAFNSITQNGASLDREKGNAPWKTSASYQQAAAYQQASAGKPISSTGGTANVLNSGSTAGSLLQNNTALNTSSTSQSQIGSITDWSYWAQDSYTKQWGQPGCFNFNGCSPYGYQTVTSDYKGSGGPLMMPNNDPVNSSVAQIEQYVSGTSSWGTVKYVGPVYAAASYNGGTPQSISNGQFNATINFNSQALTALNVSLGSTTSSLGYWNLSLSPNYTGTTTYYNGSQIVAVCNGSSSCLRYIPLTGYFIQNGVKYQLDPANIYNPVNESFVHFLYNNNTTGANGNYGLLTVGLNNISARGSSVILNGEGVGGGVPVSGR